MDKTRIVVTVLGADRCGIVAAVAGALSECNGNIVDISQTILSGIFTMTMLVDVRHPARYPTVPQRAA